MIRQHSCGGKVFPVYGRCTKHAECIGAPRCLLVATFQCAGCGKHFTQRKRLPNTVRLTLNGTQARKLRAAWKSAKHYAGLCRKQPPAWEEWLIATLLHAVEPGDE